MIEEDRVVVLWKGSEVRIDALGEGNLSLRRGWYCPEFGKKQEAFVLEYETISDLPALVGWSLMFENVWDDARPSIGPDGCVSIKTSLAETELVWKLPSQQTAATS